MLETLRARALVLPQQGHPGGLQILKLIQDLDSGLSDDVTKSEKGKLLIWPKAHIDRGDPNWRHLPRLDSASPLWNSV